MISDSKNPGLSERLRDARQRRGFESAAAAAAHFGWVVSTYQGHENGNRGVPRSKVVEYAQAFRVSPAWLLTGAADSDPLEVVKSAPVVGEVAAGVWLEEDMWDIGKYPDIPVIPGRYAALDQRAYRVNGPSMDRLRIFDGDFAVFVLYWEARQRLTEDDVVVVTRRRGSLVERTLKQIEIKPKKVLLCPRSSDVRFQEPIEVSLSDDAFDDSSIEITGLVIGAYRPF